MPVELSSEKNFSQAIQLETVFNFAAALSISLSGGATICHKFHAWGGEERKDFLLLTLPLHHVLCACDASTRKSAVDDFWTLFLLLTFSIKEEVWCRIQKAAENFLSCLMYANVLKVIKDLPVLTAFPSLVAPRKKEQEAHTPGGERTIIYHNISTESWSIIYSLSRSLEARKRREESES